MRKDTLLHDPLVSVVVSVYNTASTLPRCLDSLLAQTYRNLDIILIDDGSTDRSAVILADYAAKDPRIRVLCRTHSGLSSARNAGLSLAKGEWIGFLDSDDELLPDAVACLLRTALRADVPMSMGSYFRCVRNRHPLLISFQQPVLRDEELMRFLFTDGGNHNYMWLRLYRAELFAGISFPEGKLYEDLFVQPELALAAERCAFTAKPVYRYHIRRDSLSASLDIDRQMDGLAAALAAKETAVRAYPGLEACCSGYVLETCCWLLGKMTAAGRKRHPESWKRVVVTFRREQKTADLSSPARRLAVLLFRICPDLLGAACCVYQRLKN